MEDELQSIGELFSLARKYGLEVEVISSALQAMKNDPKLTVSEAFAAGCYEWDIA